MPSASGSAEPEAARGAPRLHLGQQSPSLRVLVVARKAPLPQTGTSSSNSQGPSRLPRAYLGTWHPNARTIPHPLGTPLPTDSRLIRPDSPSPVRSWSAVVLSCAPVRSRPLWLRLCVQTSARELSPPLSLSAAPAPLSERASRRAIVRPSRAVREPSRPRRRESRDACAACDVTDGGVHAPCHGSGFVVCDCKQWTCRRCLATRGAQSHRSGLAVRTFVCPRRQLRPGTNVTWSAEERAACRCHLSPSQVSPGGQRRRTASTPSGYGNRTGVWPARRMRYTSPWGDCRLGHLIWRHR